MGDRFYFRATAAATASPAYDATWDTSGSAGQRRLLARDHLVGDTVALGTGGTWTAGQLFLDRQYVTEPLAGGIEFNGAYVNGVIRALEGAADDNVSLRCGLRLVSQDGTVERAVLLAVDDHGSGTELGTTAASRILLAGVQISTSYVTRPGDRLVLEVGFGDASGTTPTAQALYGTGTSATAGGAGDDHLYSEGSTSSYNPWIEFSVGVPALSADAGRVAPYTVTPHTVAGC